MFGVHTHMDEHELARNSASCTVHFLYFFVVHDCNFLLLGCQTLMGSLPFLASCRKTCFAITVLHHCVVWFCDEWFCDEINILSVSLSRGEQV